MRQASSVTGTRYRLRKALQEHLRNRGSDQPVSIANMIRRARYTLPDLALNDDELERFFAEEIIASGGNIAFDRRAAYQELPAAIRNPRGQ